MRKSLVPLVYIGLGSIHASSKKVLFCGNTATPHQCIRRVRMVGLPQSTASYHPSRLLVHLHGVESSGPCRTSSTRLGESSSPHPKGRDDRACARAVTRWCGRSPVTRPHLKGSAPRRFEAPRCVVPDARPGVHVAIPTSFRGGIRPPSVRRQPVALLLTRQHRPSGSD